MMLLVQPTALNSRKSAGTDATRSTALGSKPSPVSCSSRFSLFPWYPDTCSPIPRRPHGHFGMSTASSILSMCMPIMCLMHGRIGCPGGCQGSPWQRRAQAAGFLATKNHLGTCHMHWSRHLSRAMVAEGKPKRQCPELVSSKSYGPFNVLMPTHPIMPQLHENTRRKSLL